MKILVIGATSAIAEAVLRLYAARGASLFLTGRDSTRLQAITDDLRLRGARSVSHARLDVNELHAHGPALDCAWSDLEHLDVVLLAHGTLPDQQRCEADPMLAVREFNTNATSTIALLAQLALRLEGRSGATIAVISSVAGDRGRASNYTYGSAKAAVSAYLSGLRQRLHPAGVNVLTIKPGFVDTPMTRDFPKGPLWASTTRVARGIVRAIDRRRSVAYVPGFWWSIMFLIRHIPEPLFRRIRL